MEGLPDRVAVPGGAGGGEANDERYLAAVGLPMAVIGVGQGRAFAPMTAAGLVGVLALIARPGRPSG